MKFAVCFCVHSGELEIKALLLVASLRKHWPATVELIACVPQDPPFGGLSTNAARILDSLGVRVTSAFNPIGPDYPIGNKLLCLDVETEADRVLFLDSDILALKPVSQEQLAAEFGEGFAAKPADLATFKVEHEIWRTIYLSCGAQMPDVTVHATSSREPMAPYFNAGVLSTRSKSGFGRHWAECAVIIDAMPGVPAKRPHLDQIALPVAAARLGLKPKLLSEEWNYPAHLRHLPQDLPNLCHYHWPEVLEREPSLLDAVRDLSENSPVIPEAMRREPVWHRLGEKLPRRPRGLGARNLPEGIITGIPRSGTSYLCRLLSDHPQNVVINEPAEIFAPLAQQAPGQRIAFYYRDLRRRIIDGEPIENKTDGGKIIEDTAKLDRRTAAPITVRTDDFTLWTKNTLAYLNRLPQLLEAMPEATFVACVRHPVDTISSWARTFPHLRDADVAGFPVGHHSDPLLTAEQREQLAAIVHCEDLPRRRVMLWNYLAGIVIQHQDRLVIIRLEDLAADPRNACQRVLRNLQGHPATGWPLARSAATPARETCKIWEDCSATATAFGYAPVVGEKMAMADLRQ